MARTRNNRWSSSTSSTDHSREIGTAYERMLKSDVKYRFVIDMATLDMATQG